MSHLGAMLVLHMPPPDAFVALTNMLAVAPLRTIATRDAGGLGRWYAAFDAAFAGAMPSLHAHFVGEDIEPSLYLLPWLFTLYAKVRGVPRGAGARGADVGAPVRCCCARAPART